VGLPPTTAELLDRATPSPVLNSLLSPAERERQVQVLAFLHPLARSRSHNPELAELVSRSVAELWREGQ
jgi:hypothetical protein